jgi:hypothetical protein
VPKLQELKKDFLKYRYPFIRKNYTNLQQSHWHSARLRTAGRAVRVLAEATLSGTAEFWDPVENVVC